ncbi:hypothetical protein [Saccharothrix variisporea]|uniref:Uncharacterized protein n=1 Tax=Saccharothrix variisporea TaxID=543527 RepID=A0A495XHH8_9PSEU|nr:hypothetical protein [Saccharothrix variisporea]RKT72214.1 hypothetical protein DFJ66_5522 [Saccharothrix variisporea]
MSNDDKRRRRDGSTTTQLSVAELLARREAETQPIPRITDEQTVRFTATANLSGRELHITELLKREGRAGEEERGGGFSVPKLVAMAGGGVVLAGTVAFTASNLLSSPDERPLAEVRYDTRPAARATNTLGKDLAPAAAAQQQAPETTESTPDTTTPSQTATQKPRATQQPAPTTTTTNQAPAPEQPAATTTTTPSTSTTQPTTDTPPPPTSSSSTTTPKTSDSGTTTPPSTTEPSKPGLGLGLDLGGILDPIGGFDFFAPAE